MRDLYASLGVARDADAATIKKAYKRLAKENHPDVNKDPAAEQRFKEISAAWEVLGDDERRGLYDEFGEASLQAGFDPARARSWRGMGGGVGGGMGGMGGGSGQGVSLDELFGSLFGGGRGPRQRRSSETRANLQVDLLDVARGGEVAFDVRRPTRCTTCDGEGGTGRTTCPRCAGSGVQRLRQGAAEVGVPCDTCGGDGHTFASECPQCGGQGRIMGKHRVNVRIPAGVESGQTVRLRGQGGDGAGGGAPGDLLLVLDVKPHPLLRRQGDDLELDLPLTLVEAIRGGSVEVPTPWGSVRVRVPAGVQTGQRLRVRERGMLRRDGGRGDLYLVLRPTAPVTTSDEAAALAERLEAYRERPVRETLVLDG